MKKYVIGSDIGGTTVKLGIFTIEGELLKKWEIPTNTADGGAVIVPDIAASCKEALTEEQIAIDEVAGIGIGVPGSVEGDGNVDICVNLGWKNKPVKAEMEALLGVPAAVGNDANVAALGEAWQGSGKGNADVVMVTLGTGVGGGIICDGKIVTGGHGYGGEIGHMVVDLEETDHCNCGKCGCLEQFCSATGIVRVTKKAMAKDYVTTSLAELEAVTAKDIFDAAKAGDAFAQAQVDAFAKKLALGLSYISCVTDPDVFVIGGGVSKAGAIITDSVAEHFKDFTFGKQQQTKFVLASLGNDAGIFGCAKLVLD